MTDSINPYEELQVAPDAGRDEVRRAFHQAVLRCHPDCTGGDTEEAQRRFHRIVGAYRTLRERLARQAAAEQGREDEPLTDQFDPADFASLAMGWERLVAQGKLPPSKLEWLPRMAHEKVVRPAVNETAVFVVCWIVALVLAMGAGVVTAGLYGARGLDNEAMVVIVAAMMATYAVVFALSLAAIVAARKTSWLLRVIGFRKQHALPPAPKSRKLGADGD